MSDITSRQRTVPVQHRVELKWKRPVDARLQRGELFVGVSDARTTDYSPLVAIDECGFFLRWKADGARGHLIEISLIIEVRAPSHAIVQQLVKVSCYFWFFTNLIQTRVVSKWVKSLYLFTDTDLKFTRSR